jgi:hypothetical protein
MPLKKQIMMVAWPMVPAKARPKARARVRARVRPTVLLMGPVMVPLMEKSLNVKMIETAMKENSVFTACVNQVVMEMMIVLTACTVRPIRAPMAFVSLVWTAVIVMKMSCV